jgi:hypothetical protein
MNIPYGYKLVNISNARQHDVYPSKERPYLAKDGIVVGQFNGKKPEVQRSTLGVGSGVFIAVWF